jgi:hypothetical protein
MKWRVTYVKEGEDKGKYYTEEVVAPDYSRAYLKFLYEHPKTDVIISVAVVKA